MLALPKKVTTALACGNASIVASAWPEVYIAGLTLTVYAPPVAVVNMVRLYPFSMRFSVINNAGVSLAASGNELYVRPWNEDVT